MQYFYFPKLFEFTRKTNISAVPLYPLRKQNKTFEGIEVPRQRFCFKSCKR